MMGEKQLKRLLADIRNGKITGHVFIMQPCLTTQQAIAISQAIAVNPTIDSVNFSGNQICENGNYDVIRILLRNPKITSLNLSGIGLDEAGFKVLAEEFERNNTLELMNIAANVRQTNKPGYFVPFAKALAKNKTLQYIKLHHNDLSSKQDDEALCKALSLNKTIQVLDLKWTGVSTDKVFQSLDSNNTLTSLSMFDKRDSSLDCATLTNFLKQNRALKTFELYSRMYGQWGSVENLFTMNNTLDTFKMPECFEYGLYSLVASLKNNTSLELLDLNAAKCNEETLKLLVEVLKTNRTLKKIVLDSEGMWISRSGRQMLIDMGYLDKNQGTVGPIYRPNYWTEFPDLMVEIQSRCEYNKGIPYEVFSTFSKIYQHNYFRFPDNLGIAILQYLSFETLESIRAQVQGTMQKIQEEGLCEEDRYQWLERFSIATPPPDIMFPQRSISGKPGVQIMSDDQQEISSDVKKMSDDVQTKSDDVKTKSERETSPVPMLMDYNGQSGKPSSQNNAAQTAKKTEIKTEKEMLKKLAEKNNSKKNIVFSIDSKSKMDASSDQESYLDLQAIPKASTNANADANADVADADADVGENVNFDLEIPTELRLRINEVYIRMGRNPRNMSNS